MMRRWISRVVIGAVCGWLSACGGGGESEPPPPPGPPVTIENLLRVWRFKIQTGPGDNLERAGVEDGFGVMEMSQSLGSLQGAYLPPTILDPELVTGYSKLYSDDTGRSFWVSTVAPHASPQNEMATYSATELVELHFWKKLTPDATLQYVASAMILEGASANAQTQLGVDGAEAEFRIFAATQSPKRTFLSTGFGASLLRLNNSQWFFAADPLGPLQPLTLDWNPDVDRGNGSSLGVHALNKLEAPVRINIPLDKVAVGETFIVRSTLKASAFNYSQGESFYGAYLRDPADVGGSPVQFTQVGLEPVKPPAGPPIEFDPLPLPDCTAPDPAAGTLQLQDAAVSVLEGRRALIQVTRTGGTTGEVSARVTLNAGSAQPGVDFASESFDVFFADGDDHARPVLIQALADTLIEGDETATIQLLDVRGCAVPGTPVSATLTILDEDEPPAPTYSVGGRVTGLQGSSLEINLSGRTTLTVNADGPFVLPWQLHDGEAYEVRVNVQPSNPVQNCTIARGSGVIAGANVTDVAVDCAPPLANGALDPSFGGTGFVTNGALRRALSMALQADGKIVVLADQLKIARYNTDGTLDPRFGTNGVATVSFGSSSDMAFGLALQPDGKIVVAGRTQGATSRDFAVARYLTDGSVDASFGTAGVVVADYAGENDEARVPLVQSDGHIVLAGTVLVRSPPGLFDQDFAALRLTATGAIDTPWGSGGWVRINLLGLADIVNAATLESNDNIFIAGRSGADGGALPDAALVRIVADSGFASFKTFDYSAGNHDEFTDVLMQPDGRPVMAVNSRIGGKYVHGLARLGTDALPDATFGTGGFVSQSFAVGGDFPRALALQGDGRIVTAGYTRPSTTQTSEIDDFLITRHLADGSLDMTFGTGGKVVVDFFGASDGASDVALMTDGRIVVAGSAQTGSRSDLALVRVAP